LFEGAPIAELLTAYFAKKKTSSCPKRAHWWTIAQMAGFKKGSFRLSVARKLLGGAHVR